jgi:hypothetical protein
MGALIAGGAVNAPADASALGVLVVLALLVLVFEKATTTNVATRGTRRLSRCLDVGVFPLAIGAVLLGVAYTNGLLNPGT